MFLSVLFAHWCTLAAATLATAGQEMHLKIVLSGLGKELIGARKRLNQHNCKQVAVKAVSINFIQIASVRIFFAMMVALSLSCASLKPCPDSRFDPLRFQSFAKPITKTHWNVVN